MQRVALTFVVPHAPSPGLPKVVGRAVVVGVVLAAGGCLVHDHTPWPTLVTGPKGVLGGLGVLRIGAVACR